MGAWMGAVANAPADDAPADDAPVADAPAATSAMGISFFSIIGVFSTRSEEDDGTGEAVAVRMREWASVKREKEELYKDEGGIWCTATRVRYAWLQRAPRHEANPSMFGVLNSSLGPYTEILYVLSFPLE
jgi:hypothetical protein